MRRVAVLAVLLLAVVALVCSGVLLTREPEPPIARTAHSAAQATTETATTPESAAAADDEAVAARVRVAASRPDAAAESDSDDDSRVLDDDEIRGVVVSRVEEEPLAGALVEVVVLGRPHELSRLDDPPADVAVLLDVLASTLTDADGLFAFDLPPDVAKRALGLRVTKEGYAPSTAFAESSYALTIGLAEAREWVLRVADTADRPIPGAQILVYTDTGSGPPFARAVADDEGIVRVVAAASDELIASADGFAGEWFGHFDTFTDGTIVLHAGASIAGTVVDSKGRGVTGALVAYEWDAVALTRTGAEGRFELRGTRDDSSEHRVRALLDGFLPGQTTTRAGTTDARIVLRRAASIAGAVLTADGEPADGAEVRISHDDTHVEHVQTDEDGLFTFTEVPPGRIRLVARLRTEEPVGADALGNVLGEVSEIALDVEEEQHVDGLTLQLARVPSSCVVLRVVRDDGSFVRNPTYNVASADLAGFGARGGTVGDAHWQRVAVPVGTRVVITVRVLRNGSAIEFPVTLTTVASFDAAPVDVELPPIEDVPRVELTVVLLRENGPWASRPNLARLHAYQEEGRIDPAVMVRDEVTLAPTLWTRATPGIPVGVLAAAAGHGTLRLVLPAMEAGPARHEIRLPPESVVTGRIVGASGAPISQVRVDVLVTTAAGPTSPSVAEYGQIGPGGVFRADQLAGGRGRLTVRNSDWRIVAERTFEVPVGAELAVGDVVVGSLPRVRGTVRSGGALRGGVPIEASDHAEGGYAETSSRPDGSFDLATPLRPGARLNVGGVLYDLGEIAAMSPVALRGGELGNVRIERPNVIDGDAFTFRLPGGPRIYPHELDARDEGVWDVYGLPTGLVEVTTRTGTGEAHVETVDVPRADR